MKLIDRYVVFSFLRDYLVSFLVLVGMYVVLDMVFNFDELAEVASKPDLTGLGAITQLLRYVADFYFYQSFLYFAHLSGIIPVVAASFTLMRMIRFNELSALLSAGVPLLRLAAPIIIAALFLNGLLWVDQELLIPNMIPKLIRQHDWGSDVELRWFVISNMRDDRQGKLFAGRYYPADNPPRMEAVSIVRVDETNQPISHIKADKALWDAANQRWKLLNGLIDINLSPQQPLPVRSMPLEFYQSNITPEEVQLFRSADFVELLSTQHINELLKAETYGRNALLRVKHTRGLAQILLNMVLLLLAIAAVLTRQPQQLKMAAARCLLLCGTCMTVAFVTQELAAQPPLNPQFADKWPALMAWLPIFLFGPLSIWLLDRVKT
jgi:lipopolysaccharide export system permease protein